MPIQFKRGTNADRTSITPASGEPLWTTDTEAFYIGNGSTPGGILVSAAGDVKGPASSTDSHVAFFNGATGKIIKDSGLTLSGTNTGDQTITLTGDVTGSGTGSFAATISANSVTLAKMANLAANSIIGNNTVSAATPIALSGTQVTAMLDVFNSTLKGLAPASSGGTTNFLRADGTWAAPPGGGGTVTSVAALTLGTTGTDLSSTVANSTTTPVITLNVPTASATNRGALSSTDWSTFNGKESVLTFSSPLSRVTNTISIPVATSSVNGYLSSTDWSTFNGKQDALSGTGFVKISGTTISYDNSTYLTANQTITLSGDVSGSGSTAITTTIGANKVTNSMLSQVATATFKGRTTAGTGDVEDLTGTQATALLDAFSSTLKGLAPASGGGSTNFLRADGSWAAPVGTTYTFSTGLTNTSGTITANLSTGISGGQSIKGGTAASETLRITSTDSGTKGKILFGSSVYDELNERLGLNTAAPIEIFHAVKNSASGAYARIDAINGSPGIITYRANGSVNTPTAVLSGESIGIWSLRGYDGTSYINTSAGYIEGVAAETWTSSRLGTYLTFGTTAISTSTSQERMRIDNDGNVLIGTTTNGGFKLDVNGTARIVTSLTTPTVQGSTSASGTLTLSSTSNATKGNIIFGTAGLSVYDETNNRFGIGTSSPTSSLQVVSPTGTQLFASITGTNNSTTAVATTCINLASTFSPTSNSGASYRTLTMSSTYNAPGINFTGTFGNNAGTLYVENRITSTGTITSLTAGYFVGMVCAAQSIALGTVSSVAGVYIRAINSFGGNTLTSTVTNAYGSYIASSVKLSLTITSEVGQLIEEISGGTNNTNLLLGTGTIPSGSYSIYSASSRTSYFAGSMAIGVTSTSFKLDVNGTGRFSSSLTTTGRVQATVAKTSAYTLTSTDRVIWAATSSGAFTLTLPTASTGQEYTIVKTDAAANTVTIATTGAAKINGGNTYTGLSAQYKHITVIFDGTNWFITSSN